MADKKRVVFDVDGTLITASSDPQPREEVINLLVAFYELGWEIYVHSGGGVLYAKQWVERLGLDKRVNVAIAIKGDKKIHYDLAVDDCADEMSWSVERTGNYIWADHYITV